MADILQPPTTGCAFRKVFASVPRKERPLADMVLHLCPKANAEMAKA